VGARRSAPPADRCDQAADNPSTPPDTRALQRPPTGLPQRVPEQAQQQAFLKDRPVQVLASAGADAAGRDAHPHLHRRVPRRMAAAVLNVWRRSAKLGAGPGRGCDADDRDLIAAENIQFRPAGIPVSLYPPPASRITLLSGTPCDSLRSVQDASYAVDPRSCEPCVLCSARQTGAQDGHRFGGASTAGGRF